MEKKRFFTGLIAIIVAASMGINVGYATAKSEIQTDSAAGKIGVDCVENELLVTFKETATDKVVESTVRQADAEVIEDLDVLETNTVKVEIDENQDLEHAIETFQDIPEVEAVQPNYLYTTDEDAAAEEEAIWQASELASNDQAGTEMEREKLEEAIEGVSAGTQKTADPLLKEQWNLEYIHAQEAWNAIDQMRKNGKIENREKVIVASLDTGIDLQHEDLQVNIDKVHCVTVLDGKAPTNYTTADLKGRGHGTSIAGVIAATSNNGKGMAGVAAGNDNDLIQLMGINVFRYDNATAQASASTAEVIAGLEYACAHGAQVINMALGHASGSTDGGGIPHDDALLQKKINEYKDQVVFVATAGNKGDDRVWYPSDLDHVISVINTQKYTDAWSINCKNKNSSYGSKKDISAPGTAIYKTLIGKPSGYSGTSSGTSLAAPAVSGVAAMILYVNPELTPTQVEAILCGTTTDLYTNGYDIYTGYGNVNAYDAVKAAADAAEGKAVPDPDRSRNKELLAEKAELGQVAGVTASGTGMKAITIKWKKVSGASRYVILRSTTGKVGSYKSVGTVTSGSTVKYVDKTCVYRKKYYYKVRPLGTSQVTHKKIHGTDSNAVSARSALAAPALTVRSADYKTNKLSWKKVFGADGYRIYRATSKNGTYSIVKTTTKASTTSWKDTGLKAGKVYYYKIRAYRKVSGKRTFGNTSVIKQRKAKPAKPTFRIKKKGRRVTLTLKKNSRLNGYVIYRKKGNGAWKMLKTVTVNAKKGGTYTCKLAKGKTYSFKIKAYKKVKGKRIYSVESAVKKKKV
ncbi:S8 family serine peptidase [bacterium 210820-DFI.6.37]|nr:S8 family serine peptidase [bacterium 210820-DFI.6.37]